MRRRVLVLSACLLLICVGGFSLGTAEASPTIETVAPNLVTDGNTGEYLVVNGTGNQSLRGWQLTDGSHTVTLPDTPAVSRIAVSADPAVTRLQTELPVVGWTGYLPLSASGDELRLQTPSGDTVDTFAYSDTPEGHSWNRSRGATDPRHSAETDITSSEKTAVSVTAFVLPDHPDVPIDLLKSAEDRMWLAGYELTDPHVETALRDGHRSDVDTRVIVDGTPVGGQTSVEVATLDRLDDAGIPTRVTTANRDPYRFHHPKYVIVDDTVLVSSENWKPAGTGGESSRGWGIVIENQAVANELARVFAADFSGGEALEWYHVREEVRGVESEQASGSYTASVDPLDTEAAVVEPVVFPEEGEDRVLRLLESAEDEILVQQVSLSDFDFPLIAALTNATRRGVDVSIHLDGSWYVNEENEAYKDALETFDGADSSRLSVTIAQGGARYEKIHNKGIVVDRERVLIGSLNWNNVSLRENREIAVVVNDSDVASYYAEILEADIQGQAVRTPLGLVGVAVGVWLIAGEIARNRIDFDITDDPS